MLDSFSWGQLEELLSVDSFFLSLFSPPTFDSGKCSFYETAFTHLKIKKDFSSESTLFLYFYEILPLIFLGLKDRLLLMPTFLCLIPLFRETPFMFHTILPILLFVNSLLYNLFCFFEF